MLVRLWALLSGSDGAGKRALPIGEFLHPLSIACLALLVVNDHLLKGSGLVPGSVTGKLSDFAGLAFFPLLVTAVADISMMGLARLSGARIDFSLRRWKIWTAVVLTALGFAAIKLNSSAADLVAGWLSVAGWKAAIVADPTDLFAFVAFALPLWIARAEIRRIPLGRLEVIERSKLASAEAIADMLDDVGDHATVAPLAEAIHGWQRTGDGSKVTALLQVIREPRI